MKNTNNQRGVSLITLVITIVVIIILALIGYRASTKPMDQAELAKFSEEITDIKKEVEAKKLFNSRDGLDEATLNRDFKKVKVENPPSTFASFDTDENTGYLVDLNKIQYDKIRTGQAYRSFNAGDTVTFDKDDVYVYDRIGNVFYLKGMYIEGEGLQYTVNEKKFGGPLLEAENTHDRVVEVRVTPINGGTIQNVTVGGQNATQISEGVYEATMDKNGTFLVIATEQGTGSSKTTVRVTKGDDDGVFVGEEGEAPTLGSIQINGGEPYTTDRRAIVHIQTDAMQMNIKRVTNGGVPTIPSNSDSGWRTSATSYSLQLMEGSNDVYAWFKNQGNSTVLDDQQSIILDTTPPTDAAPSVVIFDEHSFRITANQIDPAVGSGLKEIKIGYKKEGGPDFIWTTVSDISNPTIEVTGNEPGVNYIIKSTAEDNVGHLTESKTYETGKLTEVPGGVRIDYNPTSGWTRQSTVIITYPNSSSGSTYERWYRINGSEWSKASGLTETILLDENAKVDAVVVKKVATTTYYGEMASVDITNIDSTAPTIEGIEFH